VSTKIGSTVTRLPRDAPRAHQRESAGVAAYASDALSPDDVAGGKALIDPLDAIISRIQDDSAPIAWEVIHQLHSFPSAEEMAFRGSQPKPRAASPRLKPALKLQESKARLVVRYDCASADAEIERRRIAFFDVLAIGYRKSALHIDDVKGHRELHCLSKSRWLSEVISSWQSSLDLVGRIGDKQPGPNFKHYTVFSPHGRVDVVAADCRPV